MNQTTPQKLDRLIEKLCELDEVSAIGISGKAPQTWTPEEGDIDIFIYCDIIPNEESRQKVTKELTDAIQNTRIGVFEKGHWGVGDFATLDGIETWMMYFTIDETLEDIEEILSGNYPDRLDNEYYPIARCAMFRDLRIQFDKNGFLTSLKNRFANYPDELARKMIHYHLEALEDTEDLIRAVQRKDVLFYHFAMEIALDHFLQALFAINRIYFPSRKRSIEWIRRFRLKPQDSEIRLLKVVKLGGDPDFIEESYRVFAELVVELFGFDD
jgi:hypothetical protein